MKSRRTRRLQLIAWSIAGIVAFAGPGGNVYAQDSHAGHDHAAEAKSGGHAHEGSFEDIGTTETAGLKLAAQQLGKVEAGKQGIFKLMLAEGAKKPKSVRLWVGNASAKGSVKAKAEGDGHEYEAHAEVPKNLAADAQLWVEIEPESGPKAKAAFPIKK